jgi:hypothetical protein
MRRGPLPLFPSPSAFASLLQTFQRALAPAARVPRAADASAPPPSPAFAAALVPRRARSLADAVDVAAARVLGRLGGGGGAASPSLSILTVSPAYGSAALDAPALLAAALGTRVAVVGGVADCPGVALWTASLPDVTVASFVSYAGALPALDWGRLAAPQAGGDDDDDDAVAAAAALFFARDATAGRLAGRLAAALPPGAAVAGGVLDADRLLFVDGRVAPADAAAVGLVLRGRGVRVRETEGTEGASSASSSSILFGGAARRASTATPPASASSPPASAASPPPFLVACSVALLGAGPVQVAGLEFEGGGG